MYITASHFLLSYLPPSSEVLSERKAHGEVVEFNVIQRVELPMFPTKCSTCGQVAEEGRKLSRCTKCKAVGYCNRSVPLSVSVL